MHKVQMSSSNTITIIKCFFFQGTIVDNRTMNASFGKNLVKDKKSHSKAINEFLGAKKMIIPSYRSR